MPIPGLKKFLSKVLLYTLHGRCWNHPREDKKYCFYCGKESREKRKRNAVKKAEKAMKLEEVVMPIPGLTDSYQFIDWVKEKKYHFPVGSTVTITGVQGGLLQVDIQHTALKIPASKTVKE